MKKAIVLAAILMILVPIALAADQDDVLLSLKEFYDSAKAEDVDRYYNSQDSLYLDLLGTKDSIKGYFSGSFAQFDMLSYEIASPSYQIRDSQALVFYNLKSQIKITETGETKDIDNDMVAFLWKYNNGWKVRYTILESVYEEKLIDSIATLAAMDVMAESADNLSIQQEMVAKGLYTVSEADYSKPKAGMSWLLITAIVVVVAFAAGFLVLSKRKKGKAASKDSR
jgi:hypothetical protein